MGDIKLFSVSDNTCVEYKGKSMAIERSLQTMMERHLEELLGVRFLATEFITGKKHGGRIDTLGIDENNAPVIIEYKRSTNENVINQGLYYLDWLLDHKGDFFQLVLNKYGVDVANEIEWSKPRLLCIAGGFTKYDEYAVQQINRSIELYRYSYFSEGLLMLDLVNATIAESSNLSEVDKKVTRKINEKTHTEKLELLNVRMKNLVDDVTNYILSLGDDIQCNELKFYAAFKRIKNFVCMEVYPTKDSITLYAKVDLENFHFEEGFTKDVSQIGHFGTGNLMISIRNLDDLERAKDYIIESYENN